MVVTSHDVARLAGVSQPTVSRALRDHPKVSGETKERVRRAAKSLGYVPSAAGRALAVGRSNRVGLLVTDLANQFYPHIIAPMHHELRLLGHELLLLTEDNDQTDVADLVQANSLDGLVLATSATDSVVPLRLRDRGVPFVYFNRVSSAVDADSVVVDAQQGVGDFVAELTRLRHTDVGVVFGPRNTSTGVHREGVIRESLDEAGIRLTRQRVRHGAFDFRTGWDAATELLATTPRPTVIICANDVVAIGAFNAAVEAGLSVPGDVSIVGFDNLPEAAWPVFGLSTVAFDLAAMARHAVGLLSRRIQAGGELPFEHVEFPTTFIARRSLGPAAH